MSHNWKIKCVQHDESHWFNARRPDPLRDILRNAAVFAAFVLADVIDAEVVIRTGAGVISPPFFAKHANCQLYIVNDVGEIDGTCRQRAHCAFGTSHACGRPIGHDGEHGPGPD